MSDPVLPVEQQLEEIIATDLGEPVTEYHHPLSDEEKQAFQDELDECDRAHVAANGNLWRYFAGVGR